MKKYQLMLVVLIGALLIGCAASESSQEDIINRLKQNIDKKKNTGSIVNMAEVIDSDWDTMYIFPPFTTNSSIDKELGFDAWEIKDTRLYERDDINLIVFVKDKNVIQYIEFPRTYGDFSGISNQPIAVDKTNAVFVIKSAGSEISGEGPLLELILKE